MGGSATATEDTLGGRAPVEVSTERTVPFGIESHLVRSGLTLRNIDNKK